MEFCARQQAKKKSKMEIAKENLETTTERRKIRGKVLLPWPRSNLVQRKGKWKTKLSLLAFAYDLKRIKTS